MLRARCGNRHQEEQVVGDPGGPGSGASCSSQPCRETQVPRGRAGGAVQAAVSIVSPPGTRRCLGTVGCSAALGLLGSPPGSQEARSSRLRAGLDPAWRS